LETNIENSISVGLSSIIVRSIFLKSSNI